MKKNLKKVLLTMFSIFLCMSFCFGVCACSPKDEQENLYYSFNDVKTVINSACEIINNSESQNQPTNFKLKQNTVKVVSEQITNNVKSLKIEENNSNYGKVMSNGELLSVDGHTLQISQSLTIDVLTGGKVALKLIKGLLDSNVDNFFNQAVVYNIVNNPNVMPNTISFKIRVTGSKNLLKIEACAFDVNDCFARDVIALTFNEEKEVTYISSGSYYSDDFYYGIYSIGENKTYYLNENNVNYQNLKNEISTEVNALYGLTNVYEDSETDFASIYLSARN